MPMFAPFRSNRWMNHFLRLRPLAPLLHCRRCQSLVSGGCPHVKDPDGNILGLMQPDPSAK